MADSKVQQATVTLQDGTVLRRRDDGAYVPVEASEALGSKVDELLQAGSAKTSINLRVDNDVLEWYRAQGKGYQTLMNAVLRAYYLLRRGR